MNETKLKNIIEIKFMGGGENAEIRKQLNELIDKSVPISTEPIEFDNRGYIAFKLNVCPKCRFIVINNPKYCNCGQRLF